MSSFQLKLVAIITMTIDHVGLFLCNNNIYMRMIGRIAFPIFAFLVVEGFFHTRNFKKYLINLLAFAIICQLPMLWGMVDNFNIFFTLACGLICIKIIDGDSHYFIKFILVLILILLSEYLGFEYGAYGVMMILMFYMFRVFRIEKFTQVPFYVVLSFLSNILQFYSIFSLVFINFYNGKKGYSNAWVKYGFYLYYPIHLGVIWMIAAFI